MVFLLCLLAFAMVAIGAAAIVFGMSIVQVEMSIAQVERGWTMVVAGAVFASGGAVLFGIALAVQRLGRIASELVWIRDRLATIGEMTAEAVPWTDEDVVSDAEIEQPPPRPPSREEASPPPAEPAERVIVGQYSSGGNEYKMYSDGSIDAMTPAGLRRFASLEDLRAFVAGGGERAG